MAKTDGSWTSETAPRNGGRPPARKEADYLHAVRAQLSPTRIGRLVGEAFSEAVAPSSWHEKQDDGTVIIDWSQSNKAEDARRHKARMFLAKIGIATLVPDISNTDVLDGLDPTMVIAQIERVELALASVLSEFQRRGELTRETSRAIVAGFTARLNAAGDRDPEVREAALALLEVRPEGAQVIDVEAGAPDRPPRGLPERETDPGAD